MFMVRCIAIYSLLCANRNLHLLFICPQCFFFIAPTVKKGKYLSELPNSDDALLNRLTFSDLPW